MISKSEILKSEMTSQSLSKPTTADSYDRRIALFTIAWTLAAIILIVLTWRLWTGAAEFPQIPLLESLIRAPLIADWVALVVLLLSVLFLLSASLLQIFNTNQSLHGSASRIAAAIFSASILCLFLLNQHRLQPWAWQFFLYAALLLLAKRSDEVITSARWVTASIYFFSAISKFDYQFIYGLGGQLARPLAEIVGVEASGWMSFMAVMMPIFELLVAVLLIVGRTRKTGVVLAAVFHIALIITLGPWGLDHHTGVLIWNLFFFAITAILFWPTIAEKNDSATGGRDALMFAATLAMVLYPLLPHCDHWLAWGLYSPNNSRCDFEVVGQNEEGETVFQRVDLNAMSLEQLNVPLYPSARFQLGVAQAIKEKDNLGSRSRIIIKSKSRRFSGLRESTIFRADGQWNQNQRQFLFNWKPRRK